MLFVTPQTPVSSVVKFDIGVPACNLSCCQENRASIECLKENFNPIQTVGLSILGIPSSGSGTLPNSGRFVNDSSNAVYNTSAGTFVTGSGNGGAFPSSEIVNPYNCLAIFEARLRMVVNFNRISNGGRWEYELAAHLDAFSNIDLNQPIRGQAPVGFVASETLFVDNSIGANPNPWGESRVIELEFGFPLGPNATETLHFLNRVLTTIPGNNAAAEITNMPFTFRGRFLPQCDVSGC